MDTTNWTAEDFWQYWIETEDILSMCIYEFNLEPHEYPTPSQCLIMKKILFHGCRRLLLNCFTRFGKSHAMGILANLYVILNRNRRVNIIGPQWSQTYIIRKVAAKFLARSRTLKTVAHFSTQKEDGDVEASKKRQTFKNGCEIATLGVQGKGEQAMGEGGDLNIVDELALISPTTFRERVFRLLGDNPEESIMVGLFNPWGTDNIAADLWENPRWEQFHIDWRQGIKEGRITQDYVDEQKELLTNIEFCVLFDSKFPKQTIDTIVTAAKVREAMKRNIKLRGKPDIEIGVDVARFGNDKTVIACRIGYKLWHIEKHSKEDTMQTAGRISKLVRQFVDEGYEVRVSIDDTGIGGGVTDRLTELHSHEAEIAPIINGSSAFNSERFFNRITELWFWVGKNIDKLDLCEDADLVFELSKRHYKLRSDGKKLWIEDKETFKKRIGKSPDVADAVANAYSSFSECGGNTMGGFA